MSGFVNPSLLWGLLILAVPILIHLINLLRHRRVEWAAMEFLLQSQRKNSTWIRMKELLLLLLRVLAIAAVVLVLAQPLMDDQLGLSLSGQRTHHIVLLDDSYSMADQSGETTAFDRAKLSIQRMGDKVAAQSTPQTFSLLRLSRFSGTAEGNSLDMNQELVGADFSSRLTTTMQSMAPSQLAMGPGGAFEAIERTFGETKGEHRIVYLFTDFRTKDWDEPGNLVEQLQQLNTSGAMLQFVNCVDGMHRNLAISALEPERGTRAAGVPLAMQVRVTNYGREKARNVPVRIESDGLLLDTKIIDEIKPGESESVPFEANFETAGEHSLMARIESDAVRTDNTRYEVVKLPAKVPVLLIDADADARQSKFLALALAPGGTVKTGITPKIEQPAFLNNHPLGEYQVIYLVNFERLDEAAIHALQGYVEQGGGLVIFTGERVSERFLNDTLYRDGNGLFPAPVGASTNLLVNRLEKVPDIKASDQYPVFRNFANERNSFFNAVRVSRFFPVLRSWKPNPESGTRIIAELRNGSPLVVESRFGKGRVFTLLTTAGPLWNNWAQNPTYLPSIQEMQAYLASDATAHDVHLVGSPIEFSVSATDHQPRVRFIPPADHPDGPTANDFLPEKEQLKITFPVTTHAGIYEVQMSTNDELPVQRRFALNVDPQEGNLAVLDAGQLADRLPKIKYEYHQADQFSYSRSELAGSNWSDWLLFMLVGMLVGEQALAYSASYHPKSPEGGRP